MNGWKKLLAMLLCAAMCISMLPTWSFAEGETGAEIDSGMTEEAEVLEVSAPAEEEYPQHEHAYYPTVVDPTCTEQGCTVYTCECGDSYVSDYTDALNHPEIVEAAEIPATCTTDGMTAGKRCAVCGEIVGGCETIPATGHVYIPTVVDPSCTEQGYTVYTCECGDSYVSDYTEALNHPETVEVAEVPATTESAGTAAGTKCAVCGEILSGCEEIPAVQPATTAEPELISALDQDVQEENQAADATEEQFEAELSDEPVAATEAPDKPKAKEELTAEAELGAENKTAMDTVVASGKCGSNLTWTLDNQSVLTISGTGNMYNNCTWSSRKSSIYQVIIESGATSIGDSAFSGCSNLTDISIPSSVTSIGVSAFYGCASLHGIVLPAGITSIASSTFHGCSSLTSIMIPDGVTGIGYAAFSGCSKLQNISITNSVVSIGDYAFSGCSSLSSILLPGSLADIGYMVFKDCTSLMTVTVPGHVASIGGSAFSGCSSLESISIPASVKSIGPKAFYDCSSLTAVSIPTDVTVIEEETFYHCSNLRRVSFSGMVTTIKGLAFSGCSSLTEVVFPMGLKSIEGCAFLGCTGLTSVTFQNELKSIGGSAFARCGSLTSVSIPASVESIGDQAFFRCSSLATVTLSEGLTSIGDSAFEECESLKSISIPHTVSSIGNNAFHFCRSLESITIPSGILKIEECTFYQCSGLRNVTIPDTVTEIGEYAFSECINLQGITIPNSVTFIGNRAFSYNDMQEIALSNSITYIGDSAFYSSALLRQITLPASLEYLGDMAFGDCSLLKEVYFTGSAPTIGENAFRSVTSTVYYPDGWPASVRQDYGGTLTWVVWQNLPTPVLTEAFNSATGVRVSWNAVPGAVKYRLLRKNLTKGETAWKNVGETAECSLIDKSVASASRYTFTVECIDAAGNTCSGRDETGRTCTYIAKADITTLRAGEKGVSISWSKPAGAKNFRVMRRPDGTNSWTVIAVVEGTSYTDTTAPKGVKLWYTVRGVSMDNKVLINSYNGTGWSLYHVNPPVMTEAFNSATGVRVSWNPVTGAAKYRLLRKNLTLGETQWKEAGTTADSTIIDKTAVSSNRYTYTVECIDANGRTSSAQNATGRTCTYIAMAKITEIKGVTNGVSLTWSKPAGAKNFRVFRKVDGSGAWTAIKDIQGTTWTDTSAQKNVKYWYTVRAITLAGDMYINSYNGTGWSVTRK